MPGRKQVQPEVATPANTGSTPRRLMVRGEPVTEVVHIAWEGIVGVIAGRLQRVAWEHVDMEPNA